MATQIETALRCERCKGEGFVAATMPGRDWFAGTVDVECPACEGSGLRACVNCGSPATVGMGDRGEFCEECLQVPEPDVDDSLRYCGVCGDPWCHGCVEAVA